MGSSRTGSFAGAAAIPRGKGSSGTDSEGWSRPGRRERHPLLSGTGKGSGSSAGLEGRLSGPVLGLTGRSSPLGRQRFPPGPGGDVGAGAVPLSLIPVPVEGTVLPNPVAATGGAEGDPVGAAVEADPPPRPPSTPPSCPATWAAAFRARRSIRDRRVTRSSAGGGSGERRDSVREPNVGVLPYPTAGIDPVPVVERQSPGAPPAPVRGGEVLRPRPEERRSIT
jgi:hypothetical protein